jgi:hypothetical protein
MPNLDGALCLTDKNCHFWLSFRESEIEYAKSKCPECPAIIECAGLILDEEYSVGVLAGTSEFDRMELMWKEVDSVEGTNWSEFDRLISENL